VFFIRKPLVFLALLAIRLVIKKLRI